jgi:enoyl-[acyl-carrier protein] reductase II
VASNESSAHPLFKRKILEAIDGDTKLSMKSLQPVRLLKNKFFEEVENLENQGASPEKIAELLGKGRARKGMFEGNPDEGELEIGQISGLIKEIQPAAAIINEIISEYIQAKKELSIFDF